jgi:aspartyl aminopeptidase
MAATRMARSSQQLAADLCAFINAGPSPFHVVAESARRLDAAGFQRLSESTPDWNLRPGKKYYVTRGQSAFLAFALGEEFVPGNGYTITAAHSDSPCLRVKPVSALQKGGYHSVGVETFGGGIWHTWMDRDLSVAGRVIVARGDGKYDSRLVDIRRPILRVPTCVPSRPGRPLVAFAPRPLTRNAARPLFPTTLCSLPSALPFT